jgi:hypothetical protein
VILNGLKVKRKTISILVMIAVVLAIPFALGSPTSSKNPKAFINGIVVTYEGQDYYFKGAPTGPSPAQDVPGHWWIQVGNNQVVGRHYNDGGPAPGAMWAPAEETGILLYTVHGIIAPATLDIKTENHLKKQGYVHRHELIYADGPNVGTENTAINVYLRHTAVREFTFIAGWLVTPGIDYQFPNNW